MKKKSKVVYLLFVLLAYCQCSIGAAFPCAESDRRIADVAMQEAIKLITHVRRDLTLKTEGSSRGLSKWFGNNSDDARQIVVSVLDRVVIWSNAVSFYCLYSNSGEMVDVYTSAATEKILLIDHADTLFGYVDPRLITDLYLGLKFFDAEDTGYDSKLGAVVHELTHYWLTGNTDDVEYGKDSSLILAKQSPEKARKNADSYQYFVEDWLETGWR